MTWFRETFVEFGLAAVACVARFADAFVVQVEVGAERVVQAWRREAVVDQRLARGGKGVWKREKYGKKWKRIGKKWKKWKKKWKKLTTMGLEPTIFWFEVKRVIHYATRPCLLRTWTDFFRKTFYQFFSSSHVFFHTHLVCNPCVPRQTTALERVKSILTNSVWIARATGTIVNQNVTFLTEIKGVFQKSMSVLWQKNHFQPFSWQFCKNTL